MNDVAGQLRAVARSGAYVDKAGRTLHASPALLNLLAGLLAPSGTTMTIMSLFRFRNGPHGEPQADGSAIGRAVDIAAYAGNQIHLRQPSNAPQAIAGVARVVGALPPGLYALGLPRPGGGALIDPPNDVFLPVPSQDRVDRSPTGAFQTDLQRVLEPAQSALRRAAATASGRIQVLFPDGVDHLHVKAVG